MLLCCLCLKSLSATEKVSAGSFIVNMGVRPQGINNGLKPYGLVYELLQTYKVPIKWVINPNKQREGVDFVYKGIEYRGGSFVILSRYRTAEVDASISRWKSKGVIGEFTTTDLDLPVYATLTYAPRWTIDQASGYLVASFFQNAEIPPDAYGGSSAAFWKTPAQLTDCDDIFALPHSDPTWVTHNNLFNWNRDSKGAIWSGCHAVSVLENTVSPDSAVRLNFLSTAGLINYLQHGVAPPPYDHYFPTDPIMQFMDNVDIASFTGSESIYLPSSGSSWRNGVKVTVKAPAHPDIPHLSAGPAVVMAYGRGFDDPRRGWVMYQGGHFHNGFSFPGDPNSDFGPSHAAVQRAFFNFSFLAVIDRQRDGVSPVINAASTMEPGISYPVDFSVPDSIDLGKYRVTWSTSAGEINYAGGEVSFIPPSDFNIKIVLLTLTLTDQCGRQFFTTHDIVLNHCKVDTGSYAVMGPDTLERGRVYDLTVSSLSNRDLDAYTIEWTVSSGRIVSGRVGRSIKYVPSLTAGNTEVSISVKLKDRCGIEYEAERIVVIAGAGAGEILVPNLISTNDDGLGYDFLYISNIEKFPQNEVTIYNRWGGVVFKVKGYNNMDKAFKGFANTGTAGTLIDGVYYYVLKLNDESFVNQTDDSGNKGIVKGYFVLRR